jgi:hypothetical protein
LTSGSGRPRPAARALQHGNAQREIGNAHAHGLEHGQVRVGRAGGAGGDQRAQRLQPRPCAFVIAQGLDELTAQLADLRHAVGGQDSGPLQQRRFELGPLRRDRANGIDVNATRQGIAREERRAGAGRQRDHVRPVQRLVQRGRRDRLDPQGLLDPRGQRLAVGGRRAPHGHAVQRPHRGHGSHLGQALLARAHNRHAPGIGPRHHVRAQSADAAGPHLPQGESLDDCQHRAILRIDQDQQRHGRRRYAPRSWCPPRPSPRTPRRWRAMWNRCPRWRES